MKHPSRVFAALLCGLFLSVLLFVSVTSQSRFTALCDSLFREELESNSLTLHYTLASPEVYGIDTSKITLGSEESDFSQRARLVKHFLAIQTIARSRLTEEQQMTYDLLQYTLGVKLDSFRFSELAEPLIPSIGIQSQLPVLLAEYPFTSEQDVINYLKLLSCLPEYFNSILSVEEEKLSSGTFMDAETAGDLLTYCEQFLAESSDHFLNETFRERLLALKLPQKKKELYLKENAALLDKNVFPSYKKLQAFLSAHQHDGTARNGLSDYPHGTDYYRWLLRSEIGTNQSFEEIEAMLEDALSKDARRIAELVKAHPSLLSERQNISIDISDPSALTSYLSAKSLADFPSVKDVSLSIRRVPPSMEAHLSPAFYLVPPIDRYEENVVYLNNGSLKNSLSFFTTLAHETYPGHLYQTVFENTSEPHPIRRLLYFGGYVEGWATYAEQMSYTYAPISAELAALLSTTRAMTLNLYSHLDLYIHAYGWTEEQCLAYLKDFGITNKGSAHEMFMLVKQQPANYLKYYLGFLEICHLKEEAQTALGDDFDLKEFHRFILSCGPAPFELLEKNMEKWLKSHFSIFFISNNWKLSSFHSFKKHCRAHYISC